MKQVGSFEAKTHFSELLASVSAGDSYTITRRGQKVAMLIPFSHQEQQHSPVKGAIRAIKKLRKGVQLGKKLSIKEMRSEGRK